MLVEAVHQGLATDGVHFEQGQAFDAFGQQGVGHGGTGATGAHLHHLAALHIRQAAPEAFTEAQAIGVVADPLAVLQHHGVHRADAGGLGGEFVQQRDDRLLAGEGDVQAGVAHAFGGAEQVGEGAAVQFQLVQVDQPVEVAQALGVTLVLVHGGGAGSLDTGADQAGEDGVLALGHGAHPLLNSWPKCCSARL
ncbi:hypothetical protein D9M69_429900 [compost metagenome]